MAPEQAAGRTDAIGPATDVYALGAVLYELLVGRPPLSGAPPDEPRPPRGVRRDVPRDLEAICLKCLEQETHRRYATAGALAEDLRRFLDGRPTLARPLTGWGRAARACRRRKGALALVGLCCALAVAVGLGLWSARSPAKRTPDEPPTSAAGDVQLRQQQYVLAIGQADALLKESQPALIRESLAAWQPAPGRDDLRDFAWYWLWARGRPPRKLHGPETAPNTLAFSDDGTRLLAGTRGGALHLWQISSGQPLPVPQLWDAASGELRLATQPDQAPIYMYAFAPAARRLAARRIDDTANIVGIWDLDKPASPPASRRRWPPGYLDYPLTLSPDGRWVAMAADRSLVLWDWARDEVSEARLAGESYGVSALRFAPDGKTVAVACFSGHYNRPRSVWCQLHDTATGQVIARLTPFGGCIWQLAWSPDGKTLAAGSYGVEVRLWDVPSGRERLSLEVPGKFICDMAFSPDGRTMAVGTGQYSNHVFLYEAATGKRRPEDLTAPAKITTLAFSPDGSTIAVGCDDRLVHLWEPGGGPPFQSLPGHAQSEAWAVTFLGDAGTVASAGDDATVRLWDANTGQAGAVLRGHTALISCVAFSPRRGVLASGDYDHKVRLWDTQGRPLGWLEHAQDLRCLAFSPDGRLLATGTGTYNGKGSSELKLWDVETRREQRRLDGHTGKVRAVAFSPDGRTLYSASEDETARVWDVATGECRRTLSHGEYVYCLAVSPDGRNLVTGDDTGSVHFWDVETGQEIRVARNHSKAVRAVAFSPDGKTVATGGMDRSVRLWQAATGQQLLAFLNQPHDINSLAFAPDGTALAVALHDGSIRIWHAPRADE
jgi:WD40 repeat protein